MDTSDADEIAYWMNLCHCGEMVFGLRYGVDLGPAAAHLCEHCLPHRCDAYPGECGR